MQWVGWILSPARPTDCQECKEIAADNNTVPNCEKCSRPKEQSNLNLEAWAVWSLLDSHGRDLDTMAGNPLPLRIEALDRECYRHEDPDAVRWRVLLIEDKILEYRREKTKRKHKE